MTPHRAANIVLAIVGAVTMAAVLSAAGPALDRMQTDIQERIDSSQSTQDAQHSAQAQARFEHAARALCGGENAAYELLPDGAIQCYTHRGHKTLTAKVAL